MYGEYNPYGGNDWSWKSAMLIIVCIVLILLGGWGFVWSIVNENLMGTFGSLSVLVVACICFYGCKT